MRDRYRDRRSVLAVLGAVTLLLAGVPSPGQAGPEASRVAAAPAAASENFPRPAALAARIEFWKAIFTRYSEDQVVVHDAKYVDKVYAVLDLGGATDKEVAAATAAEKKRIQGILLLLHRQGGAQQLGGEARRVHELFRDVPGSRKFLEASDRVRAQAGLQERFAEGLRVSRRYLPEMEAIFAAEGLPVELTRLPFIESCFDVRAYSWRGAAGIWQFMPQTGRKHGLRVDRLVDERRDPLRATRAAAGYLREAHAALGNWPLAITSYNHGVGGIARGVREVGSPDIVALIERYEGRGFGFAGRNFYPEFVAALEVDRDAERFFGPLDFEVPIPTQDVLLTRSLSLGAAAQAAGLSRDEFLAHNPALGSAIARGAVSVPHGYRCRVPAARQETFQQNVAALPILKPVVPVVAQGGTHRVRTGDTLSRIAGRYGVSVTALMRHNHIRNPDQLRVGQVIAVPEGKALRAPTSGRFITHRVRKGQTLSQIAARYGTSVMVLKRQNGIRDPRRLRVGQLIKVPTG